MLFYCRFQYYLFHIFRKFRTINCDFFSMVAVRHLGFLKIDFFLAGRVLKADMHNCTKIQ